MTDFNSFKKAVSSYKEKYNQAVKAGQDQFIFQGQDVLTAFAKYHLEYLEGLVKKGRVA